MSSYENYAKLKEVKGVNDFAVSKATGIAPATMSDWKNGRTEPKIDKLQKIADYFNVSIEYLMTGKDTEKVSDSGKKYYFSDETAELAQEAFTNKKTRILLDATRDLKPDDMQMVIDLAMRLKGTNTDG